MLKKEQYVRRVKRIKSIIFCLKNVIQKGLGSKPSMQLPCLEEEKDTMGILSRRPCQ